MKLKIHSGTNFKCSRWICARLASNVERDRGLLSNLFWIRFGTDWSIVCRRDNSQQNDSNKICDFFSVEPNVLFDKVLQIRYVILLGAFNLCFLMHIWMISRNPIAIYVSFKSIKVIHWLCKIIIESEENRKEKINRFSSPAFTHGVYESIICCSAFDWCRVQYPTQSVRLCNIYR